MILSKNDEVIDFLTSPPTHFSAFVQKNNRCGTGIKLRKRSTQRVDY